MEHRWSGHLAAIDVISCNKTAICEALKNIRDNAPTELAVLAIGFLVQIQTDQFSFITAFLNRLLHLIEPVNKQLQADTLDVPAATKLINSMITEVKSLRSDAAFKQMADECGISLVMRAQQLGRVEIVPNANVDLHPGLPIIFLIIPDIDMMLILVLHRHHYEHYSSLFWTKPWPNSIDASPNVRWL